MNKNKKAKIFFRQANQQGSVLAFTLIVMFIFLVIAIGIANVSVKEIKMSSDTGKSITAYQAADSGAEVALEKIIGHSWTVNDFDGDPSFSCVDGAGLDPAVITGSAPSGDYNLTFKDSTDLNISACNDAVTTIDKIKSSGSYLGTNRAVEVDL